MSQSDRSLEAQQKIFEALLRVKKEFPDMRTGQILSVVMKDDYYSNNSATTNFSLGNPSTIADMKLFNTEDDNLARLIDLWLEKQLIMKLAGVK